MRTQLQTTAFGLLVLGVGVIFGRKRLAAILVGVIVCATAQIGRATTVCAAGATTLGVDVSQYDGSIDWSAVASAGITFAIIRADYGVTQDVDFSATWSAVGNTNLIRGAYQFFDPALDAQQQADDFLATIGTLRGDDLPPMLDVETSDGQTAQTVISGITTWVAAVKAATGRNPVIYTGKYFWVNTLGSPSIAFAQLWIAQWSGACPDIPDPPWNQWVLWQYSDAGSVAGKTMDVDYFNGSLSELQVYVDRIFAGSFDP
jgi:lysozyme